MHGKDIFQEDKVTEENTEKITEQFSIKWTGPTGDDLPKDGKDIWKISYIVEDEEGNPVLDEDGNVVRKFYSLEAYEDYTFKYTYESSSVVVPPLNTYYTVDGIPGDFSIAGEELKDNSLRDAIIWAKRANYQKVLGYAYDPLSIPADRNDTGVLVGAQVAFAGTDDFTHSQTIKVELFKTNKDETSVSDDKDSPIFGSESLMRKGKFLNSEGMFELNLDSDDYNPRQNDDMPGEHVQYQNFSEDMRVTDDNSSQKDVFDLGKGDDVIYLGGDTDIVSLNDGDDKLITKSGQGHVSADGGRGDDVFIHKSDIGSYHGQTGSDHLIVEKGLSYFKGGAGKDLLQVKGRPDVITTFSDFTAGVDRVKVDNPEQFDVSYSLPTGMITLTSGQTRIRLAIGQEFLEDSGNADSDWKELAFANLDQFNFQDIPVNWAYRDFDSLASDYAYNARNDFIFNRVLDQEFDLITVDEFRDKITGQMRDEIVSSMVANLAAGTGFSDQALDEISAVSSSWLDGKSQNFLPSDLAVFINDQLESQYAQIHQNVALGLSSDETDSSTSIQQAVDIVSGDCGCNG